MGMGGSGLARYVVDAVVLEGRSAREVAKAHGISKSWIYELIARYRDGGYKALEPRSKRPRSCRHGTPQETINAIVALRTQLHAEGHDAGPATIAYHLTQKIENVPSRATIWRILRREGLILLEPQKRPRSSLTRFEADLPNETWQTDVTHWHLKDGEHVEILNIIDDHSRLFLASEAYPTVKAQDVVDTFHKAAELHGLPASLLSDNGAVFTATPRKGKVLLQTETRALRDHQQELTAIPPPNLRKDRAATPNTQALPRPPTPRKHAHRPANPARHVRPLLQQHPPPQSTPRTHTTTGLQRTDQGQTSHHRSAPNNTLPRPPRQGRPRWTSDPPPQQPTTPHRHRQSTHRTSNQAPHRRPGHPHHRPRERPTHTPSHAQPQPRLPTTQPNLNRLRSPETPVQDVPRHNKAGAGFEPATFGL